MVENFLTLFFKTAYGSWLTADGCFTDDFGRPWMALDSVWSALDSTWNRLDAFGFYFDVGCWAFDVGR